VKEKIDELELQKTKDKVKKRATGPKSKRRDFTGKQKGDEKKIKTKERKKIAQQMERVAFSVAEEEEVVGKVVKKSLKKMRTELSSLECATQLFLKTLDDFYIGECDADPRKFLPPPPWMAARELYMDHVMRIVKRLVQSPRLLAKKDFIVVLEKVSYVLQINLFGFEFSFF
jgi:hypothetical protein